MVPTGVVLDGELLASVRALIAAARQHVAQSVNTTLVLLYWEVGDRLRREVLQDGRAAYGRQAVERLAEELTREFGSGYTRANLFHMARFAEAFPDSALVTSFAERLSWTHLRTLTYVADPLARQFHAEMTRVQRWPVRELARQIQGMLYERVGLSKRPEAVVEHQLATLHETGAMTPDLVFTDPVNLGALGLRDLAAERDLEAAILAELEAFLRELGAGFAFVRRQYTFVLDGDTFAIDLLCYNRRLRCLVAIELKLGAFDARDLGQMELYLRWLDWRAGACRSPATCWICRRATSCGGSCTALSSARACASQHAATSSMRKARHHRAVTRRPPADERRPATVRP